MEVKTIIIIIIAIGIVLFFKFVMKPTEQEIDNTNRPDLSKKPMKFVENDKLILIKNIKIEYLKKAIEQFSNGYNQESFVVLPRLITLENSYAIVFPYDADFEIFCYFINYIINAHQLCLLADYKPALKAWCTTKENDTWMKSKIADKKVMIYIPEWDDEHDNVYLTTEDNLGYKMGFALGHQSKPLDSPVKRYEEAPYKIEEISNDGKVDFE